MKEEIFKKQYAEEQDRLHAPVELIALTKKRVAAERETSPNKRTKIIKYMPAAAALLFISLCVFWQAGIGNEKSSGEPGIYLGSADAENGTWNEDIQISHVSVLPVEFGKETAWTEEIEGRQVWFAVTSNGTYLAAYKEEDYVVVDSGDTDKNSFIIYMQHLLAQ